MYIVDIRTEYCMYEYNTYIMSKNLNPPNSDNYANHNFDWRNMGIAFEVRSSAD